MDAVSITYAGLGALILGGLTVFRFLWTVHTGVIKQKEKHDGELAALREKINSDVKSLDDKTGEKVKAIHERVESNDKAIAERFERNARECRANEKELGEKLVRLEVQMVTEASFDRKIDALKSDIEGNVQKTVEAAVTKSQSEILETMREMLKNFRP